MRTRQAGMAVIETILFGMLLLVPLMWALGVLADLHKSALAATSAAREAGFDAAAADDLAGAARAVDEAVTRAFVDQGLDPSRARVEWNASSDLARGSEVEVEVAYPVSVAQAPILGSLAGPSIWVNAHHSARSDPFRSLE